MKILQQIMNTVNVVSKWLLPILLILLLTGTGFSAQTGGRVVLNEKAVVKTGTKITDFVPRGWKIEQEIKGDLNADSIEDVVLGLVEDKPEKNSKGEYQDRYRALVILFRNADGQYQRGAVAGKLIQCTGCGGMLGNPVGADIKISKGVLIVSQLSGSREATDRRQRFRYDKQSRRFMLIGEDIDNYDRATGDSVVASINYLTGQKIIEKKKFNQKLDKYVSISRQVKTVQKKPIPIEEVDYEK